MDAEQFLAQLQAAVEQQAAGVELWFDTDLWLSDKARGVSFAAYCSRVLGDHL